MTENNKRSRGLVAAVVVLVALVGVSLVALLLNRSDDGGRQAAPSAVPSAAQPTAASSPPPAPDLPPLTAAPTGVTWQLFQGVALPTSSTDGPTRVDGPVHAGFSRTPTGALLADAQISARVLIDPNVPALRQVSEAQLAEGAGKTAYLNLIAQLRENNAPAGGYAQIVGFRYITYTADVAVISRATRDKGGRLQASTDTVRWVDGDWKLEKPATGLQQAQLIQDLSGYVPWSGVS